MKVNLYRVWNIKEKKMYYPGSFRLKFNRDKNWYVYINPLKAPESPSQVIIMEYSGREDKTGRKIYEGDNVLLEGRELAEIYFQDGEFKALQKNTAYRFGTMKQEQLEVIGNKYER